MNTGTRKAGAPSPAELVEIMERIDPKTVAFNYDRDTDTLLVHFFGEPRRAVSLTYGPLLYVLFDRERGEVVGLHFENFLRNAVTMAPDVLRNGRVLGFSEDDVVAAMGVPRWRRALRLYSLPSAGPKPGGEQGGQAALRSLEPLFPAKVQRAFG